MLRTASVGVSCWPTTTFAKPVSKSSNAGFVAAKHCIKVELLPRDCVLLGTHAQEPAESCDCIYDMAADFFNNEALDCADLLSIFTIYGGAFDTVAFDKRMTRSG